MSNPIQLLFKSMCMSYNVGIGDHKLMVDKMTKTKQNGGSERDQLFAALIASVTITPTEVVRIMKEYDLKNK